MKKRPRTTEREKLALARAQLRAFGRAFKAMPPPEWGSTIEADARAGQPRFVQVFTMQRGYYHALGALDALGQLWERHQTVDKANKVVTKEWWEKMPMERRP